MRTLQISRQLKDWRAGKNLSQAEAAEKPGVPLRTLQQWEQGRQSPRGLALNTLLEKLLN